MRTLSIEEASKGLSNWLRRAVAGEQIAIREGGRTVLLQPLPESRQASETTGLAAREALGQLQSGSRVTAAQAELYLQEVRAERLTEGRRNGR